jgi:hypothetical protein
MATTCNQELQASINQSHASIEHMTYEIGSTNSCIEKVEHKFDTMEAKFTTQFIAKLHYVVLYLDPEHWQWWQWHKNSCQGYISWTQFVAELYAHFDTNTHYLDHLTKLKQSCTVEEFITSFEHLSFQIEGMSNAFFHECFISGLKDEI